MKKSESKEQAELCKLSAYKEIMHNQTLDTQFTYKEMLNNKCTQQCTGLHNSSLTQAFF